MNRTSHLPSKPARCSKQYAHRKRDASPNMHSRAVTPLTAHGDVPLNAVCSKRNSSRPSSAEHQKPQNGLLCDPLLFFPTASTATSLPSGRKLSPNQMFDAKPKGPRPAALGRDTITSESSRDPPAAAAVPSVQFRPCDTAPTIERKSVQTGCRPKPSSEKSLVPVAVKIVDALNLVTLFVAIGSAIASFILINIGARGVGPGFAGKAAVPLAGMAAVWLQATRRC